MVHSLNLQLPKFLFDMQLDSTSSDNLKLVLTALFPSICNIDFSGTGLDLSAITTTLHELIVTNCSLKCVTQILGIGQYFLPMTVFSYLWFIVVLVIIYLFVIRTCSSNLRIVSARVLNPNSSPRQK